MREYADGNPWLPQPASNMGPVTEYMIARGAAEDSLLAQLRKADLIASAVPEYVERRVVLDPSLFDVMHINYEFEEVVGLGRSYKAPEIFEPTSVPANIRKVPGWLTMLLKGARAEFQPDADYRHLTLNGRSFTLGDTQAKVVGALHRAQKAGFPWVHGKTLLAEAGSKSRTIGDLFKSQPDWRELIDSDRQGRYRPNLTD